jgi:glycosyltransferase involved in cell wall biosynthesis
VCSDIDQEIKLRNINLECEKSYVVSVIIPYYNRAKVVLRTLDSVLEQTYRPIEVVLIDDGSDDDGYSIVESWKQKNENDNFRIKILRQENSGAPASRNLGLRYASGEFVQFLDSDDLLHSEKIKLQIDLFKGKDVNVVFCDFQIKKDEAVVEIRKNNGNLLKKMHYGGSVFTATPLIRANVAKGINWSENLSRYQDKDYFYKLLLLHDKYDYLEKVLCSYVWHCGEQISKSYGIKSEQVFGRIKSILCFLYTNNKQINFKSKVSVLIYIFFVSFNSSKLYLSSAKRVFKKILRLKE